MKQLANISIILLLFISGFSFGQVQLGRQVIGSTGGFSTGTSMTISSTVGEAVNYEQLIPILVKGMQEQPEMIDELKKEVNELKNE